MDLEQRVARLEQIFSAAYQETFKDWLRGNSDGLRIFRIMAKAPNQYFTIHDMEWTVCERGELLGYFEQAATGAWKITENGLKLAQELGIIQ